MTTMVENERLAVLENQYKTLQSDVTEIKTDVKALVSAQFLLTQAMAVRDAAAFQDMKSRANTGTWVRSMLPWIVATLALVLSTINMFLLGTP